MLVKLWMATLILVLGTSHDLGAQTPPADDGSARVQLLSFIAPIHSPTDASLRETPVTLFLQVTDSSLVSAICELSPRLRDAIMETLSLHPIPVNADRKLDTAAVEPMLLEATNKALRQNLVSHVELVPGLRKFSTGSSRSRATALGCSKIK